MTNNKFVDKERMRTKKLSVLSGILLMFLGVGVALAVAFGSLKLYEFSKKSAEVPVVGSITPTPTTAPGFVEYKTGLSEVLSDDTFVDNKEGFSIRPPKDWVIDISGKLGAPVFFFSPKSVVEGEMVYKANINVQTGLAKGHLLDGYKQFYVADLKTKLLDLKIHEERKLILSGRDAVLMKISFEKSDLKLKGEVLLMVTQDTAYVATGLDLERDWSSVENAVESSLYTFNLL